MVRVERQHQDHWKFDEMLTLEDLHWILCQESNSKIHIILCNGNENRNGSILLALQMRHILASIDSVASAVDGIQKEA